MQDSWQMHNGVTSHIDRHAYALASGRSQSEGFPNGRFNPCALWCKGPARWESRRRVVAVTVGVSTPMAPKWHEIKEKQQLLKLDMSEKENTKNAARDSRGNRLPAARISRIIKRYFTTVCNLSRIMRVSEISISKICRTIEHVTIIPLMLPGWTFKDWSIWYQV